MPVIAAAPHAPTSLRRAIDRLRTTRRQSLQPADERPRMVAFDEEMDVIALHGEWTTRNADLWTAASERRKTRKTRADRRGGSSSRARSVTCTGHRA